MVLNDSEGFAPDFEPISGAAFLRVEHGDPTRMLNRGQSKRHRDRNARDNHDRNAAAAARKRYRRDTHSHPSKRGARGCQDECYTENGNHPAEKQRGPGFVFWNRDQHPNSKRRN